MTERGAIDTAGDLDDRHAVQRALRRATDVTTDAWAVLRAVRAGDAVEDLILLYGNAAYWSLTGFDPSAAVGRRFTELVPGIDWTRGVAALSRHALESGTDVIDREARLEFQSARLAGTDRVFEIEFSVDGDLLAVGFRDVTEQVAVRERRRVEARRNEAVARFLSVAVDHAATPDLLMDALAREVAETVGDLCAIIETMPGGVRVAAVAGGPGDIAERIRSTHGGVVRPPSATGAAYDGRTILLATISDELRGRIVAANAEFGLPPDLAETVSGMLLAAIRVGGEVVGRIHVERFGGAEPYTEDDKVTLEALASSASLVFERRAADAASATALRRFEALFQQAPIPMIFAGDDRMRVNAASCELFGRTEEEIIRFAGRPDSPWIPEGEEAVYAALRQSFRSREVIRAARLTVLRPSGARRLVESSSIPLTGPDGQPVGVVAILNDITEQASLEAQLRHAQKMEALGRLAGGIAHDFNNVLMAILGYAEFVAADLRRGTASVEDADNVVASTRKAIDLTARLTTFARRDVARRAVVEVDALVASILPLVRRLAPATVEIVPDLQPGPPVLLDPTEFEQVIVNLVVNAVDAMPDGGRLTIESRPVSMDARSSSIWPAPGAGTHMMVAVTDTGTGMDEPTRQRIFDPFYTTKPVGEGTGLGLSMAFAAVERVGGTIWVYSEPGQGATFKIFLPPAEGTSRSDPGAPVVDERSLRGTETVLVVEDDDRVRDLVERGLRGFGYDVTAAALPSEALRWAEGRRFDVLVTDVVMPELTGDRVAAQFRQAQPDLAVVYMSGYSESVLSFETGPRDVLVGKPLTPTSLAEAIRTLLDRDTIGT